MHCFVNSGKLGKMVSIYHKKFSSKVHRMIEIFAVKINSLIFRPTYECNTIQKFLSVTRIAVLHPSIYMISAGAIELKQN